MREREYSRCQYVITEEFYKPLIDLLWRNGSLIKVAKLSSHFPSTRCQRSKLQFFKIVDGCLSAFFNLCLVMNLEL